MQPTCRQMVSLQLKPLSSRSGFTPGERDRQAEGALRSGTKHLEI